MSPRKTLALSALFFAGLAALWWADYARIPTSKERQRRSGRVLPGLLDVKPEEVARVEIDSGEARLAFERRGDRWWMTRPHETLADRSRLNALVVNLKGLPASAEGGAVSGPASQYGLEPPAHVVRVYGPGSEAPLATLDVGKALEGQRYVRAAGGEDMELADARLLAALDRPEPDWRERNLFYAAPFDVQSIAIEGPGRELEARRTADRWRLTRPIRAPGDGAKFDGLLAALNSWRVVEGKEGFVEDRAGDLAKYGLDQPRLTVRLATASTPDRPQVLHVGKAAPGEDGRAFARRGDGRDVLLIDARPLASLPEDAHHLRSLKLAELSPDRVDLIRVRAGSITHLLARDARGWTVLEPDEGRGDRTAIQNLLTQLDKAQIHEIVPPDRAGKTGLDKPRMTLEAWEDALPESAEPLRSSAEKAASATPPTLSLRLGDVNPLLQMAAAQTEGDPAILRVPKALADLIPRGPLAYRDRVILAQDVGRITRIKVERSDRTVVLEGPDVRVGAARWRLTAPVEAPADPQVIGRLGFLLAGLRAESLVRLAEGDLAPFGLDRPTLKVSWGLRPTPAGLTPAPPPPEYEGTLEVGGPVPGGSGSHYARIAGRPMVFTLLPQALAILLAEPRDHRVFRFDPAQVARLVLTWPETSVTLARKTAPTGGAIGWESEGGDIPAGLDLSRTDELLAALANLSTAAYAQYDGPFRDEWGLAPPAFRVEVQLKAGAGTRLLRIGRNDPTGARLATAETGPTGAVFLLPGEIWDRWVHALKPTRELPRDVFAH